MMPQPSWPSEASPAWPRPIAAEGAIIQEVVIAAAEVAATVAEAVTAAEGIAEADAPADPALVRMAVSFTPSIV